MDHNKYKNAVFVCDLDGTLLDSTATLPEMAAHHLKILADNGIRVTFSTARTIRSVKYILEGVPVRDPVALMNGVLLCDPSDAGEKYISAAYIDERSYHAVLSCLADNAVTPFVYSLDDGVLATSYTEISNEYMENFMRERVDKYNKPFTKLKCGEIPVGRPIYFAAMDEESVICRANEACMKIPNIRTACYRDSYVRDVWYLEVFSSDASKYSAAKKLRAITGTEYIVSFGDNYNDIPMFEASDEAYAVEGAPSEVIRAANGVVDSPELCGVTRKIGSLTGIKLTP